MRAEKSTAPEPITGTRFIFAPPPIRTREEALEFLEGRFADQLRCLSDLAYAGLAMGDVATAAHDLAQTAEDLAEALRSGRSIEVALEGPGHVSAIWKATKQLAKMARSSHWQPKAPDGLGFDVHEETIPCLAEMVVQAVSREADEARREWNEEQTNRMAGCRELAREEATR